MAAVRKQRGCGRPELNFFFFFVQYLSRTMSAGSVGDGRASAFQLVNLAIMQQDQTPFSPSPGPVSETQGFWVDIRNTKLLGGPQQQQEPPPQLVPKAAAPGTGMLWCEPGRAANPVPWSSSQGTIMQPALWAAGARRWWQGMSFMWRWP